VESLTKGMLPDRKIYELCSMSKSTVPGACFVNVLKILKNRVRNKEDRQNFALEVCKNATDRGIEKCVSSAPKSLNLDQVINLCGNGGEPIPCFELIRRKYRSNIESAVQICSGANSVFPGSCSLKLPKEYNATIICQGALSDAPAECVRFFKRKGKFGLKREDIHLLCKRAATIGPAQCIAMCPKSLASGEKVALCKNALSDIPAKCYNEAITDKRIRSKRRQPLVVNLIIQLCHSAKFMMPALCMKNINDKRLNLTERVLLCQNSDSDAPIECYISISNIIKDRSKVIEFCRSKEDANSLQHSISSSKAAQCVVLAPSKLSDEEKLNACSAASSSAPGECLQRAMASNIPKKYHIQLCRQTNSSTGPANCFSVTTGDINGLKKAKLCARATSEAPARCVQKIISRHMLPNDKIYLCNNAIDDWPAKCSNAIPRRGIITETEVSRLCNMAKSLDPGQCFLSAPPMLSSSQKILLCHGIIMSQHVVKCATSLTSIQDLEKRVEFCSKATSSLLLHCMSEVSYSWSDELRMHFCSSIRSRGALLCLKNLPPRLSPKLESTLCMNAINTGPVHCLQAMPGRYSDEQIVEMCRGAETDVPARCARAAGVRINPHDVVFVCKHAVSTTPGQCIAHHSISSTPTSSTILGECKDAIALPTEVVVIDGWQKELSYHERDGETPLTSQIVAIVHNQYGSQICERNLLPKLYINVDRGREIGARLTSSRSVSPDNDGRYVFTQIKIKSQRGGIFWIRIGGAAVKATRIPFRVLMREVYDSCTGGVAGCNFIYHSMKSFKRNTLDDVSYGGNLVGYITSPALIMAGLACADKLASDQTLIHYDYHFSRLLVSVTPRSLGRLKARLDIPTVEMSPYERLHIKENTTDKKVIKKAYRQKALEWHPDKWNLYSQNYSICDGRVSEIFGLIIDAYYSLSDEK
jgi:hypothetical protein